jgi:hypothetical protein
LKEIQGIAIEEQNPEVHAQQRNHQNLVTEIDACFAPHAVSVAVQFAADQRGRFRGALHERGVIVVRDS